MEIELIKKHIELFPTMESHYCRSSSNRKYLDAKLTIKKMHEQFISYFKKNLPANVDDSRVPSAKVYRDYFCSNYNLSFYVPKKDQCSICARKKVNMQNDEQMRVFEDHIRDMDRAQAEKQIDKKTAQKMKLL